MGKFVDHKGKTFGNWTVLEFAGNGSDNRPTWLCECKCGTKRAVSSSSLTRGRSKSCGCFAKQKNTKHGMNKSKEHKTWVNIKHRCYGKNNNRYNHYGGRGIKVCERWLKSFENFYEDMGDAPSSEHSIERLDVNQDYSPNNCVWANFDEQNRNRRKSKRNSSGHTGVAKCFKDGKLLSYKAQWCELDGRKRSKSFSINKYGKEEAFRLACQAREDAIKRLNDEGAGYSENHGK